MRVALAALFLAVMAAPVSAQHDVHEHNGPGHGAPYAGLQDREIASLSSDEIADLRDGRGMGYALAAELNGYPGPMHTLELAEPMGLTAEQQSATQALYEEMQAEAARLGEEVLESERALDRLFSEGVATPESVAEATRKAAGLESELRAHHLSYHLLMMDVLTEHQIRRYAHLRGYGDGRRH
jgi:hypothetical protein